MRHALEVTQETDIHRDFQVLALDNVTWNPEQAVFTLHGLAKGTTEVWVSAVSGGTATGGAVTGGVSHSIQVTVEK